MGGLLGFLLIYTLGGITFVPLVIAAFLLHAYLTFPIRNDSALREDDGSWIIRPEDDIDAIERARKTLGEKFHPRNNRESDVYSGYFSVSREYTPGGVNGRPPERSTPLGSTTVSAPSPSVYQSMYRSLFERKPLNNPLDNKGIGKPQKRGGNVFYVVLRHGHLMLFDDDEQLEVRHVVSLAHHEVKIYAGGEECPEGELFIKRNAICLSRRTDVGEITPDGRTSKPFFLFSENCSEKEDFYYALLRNQERKPNAKYNPPIPLQYDVKDIISLVQKLHSSEEHLQTRWINALIGRVFLALYKTPEVEDFIRAKMTKKISRVKTPSFLSKIALRHIYMGEAAPVITNPRLKDLTVDGELVVEADFRYSGNFRIEVATTARIELGSRFKAREVNLLLAVVLKRIEGHMLIRIKPPPSNRLWMSFQTMPKIDMHIEPIVSSKQITWTLILRQIENRIKEVVAESLVYPNWDDSPFYNSEGKTWRGGIWADESGSEHSHDARAAAAAAEDADVDDTVPLDTETDEATIEALPQIEKSHTAPLIDPSPSNTAYARRSATSAVNLATSKTSGSSTSIEPQSLASETPRVLRSGSFASASSPLVSTDITHADAVKNSPPTEHSQAIAAISALSQTPPSQSPIGALSSSLEKPGSYSSTSSSKDSVMSESELDHQNELTPQQSSTVATTTSHSDLSSYPSSLASMSKASFMSDTQSNQSSGSVDSRREKSTSSSAKSSSMENKRLSLAAVTNAAATAKKWGWNALQRNNDQKTGDTVDEGISSRPLVMGRGQPLPPPGVPLPRPKKVSKTAPIAVPKRKPIAPPPNVPPKAQESQNLWRGGSANKAENVPPPLPKRRSREETMAGSRGTDDGLLVVAAPTVDSEPTTPMSESVPVYLPPWVDDLDEETGEVGVCKPEPSSPKTPQAPRLPTRRKPHRVLSSSPEEDGHQLPSWLAAQEEEARAKSTFVDEDGGV